MSARLRLLMVLPALLFLGACLAPTDPGMPGGDRGEGPSDEPDGNTFNTVPAPVILV